MIPVCGVFNMMGSVYDLMYDMFAVLFVLSLYHLPKDELHELDMILGICEKYGEKP